jgi:secondary thiamine-phosphate synthase enzyme
VRQHQEALEVSTRTGRAIYDITRQVAGVVAGAAVDTGLCTLFIRHTSASLIIQENADPDVLRDLETFLSRIAPDGDPAHTHTAEGPDDMPGHIRSVLTATSLSVPITAGRLALGTWQGIYLWEHRHRPHHRTVVVHVTGQ